MFHDNCVPEIFEGLSCGMAGKRHRESRPGDAESPKKGKGKVSDDWIEIFKTVNKRRNPYDPFPEEQRNYTLDEILEILYRLGHMWK